MKRTITATIKSADGRDIPLRHESENDPAAIAMFITSVTDDNPGTDITFVVRSDGER